MSQLDLISPEERDLVIGLPYRVGVFVSHADDEGGEEDDEKEMQALERILTAIARQHEKSPFVQDVLQQTIASKDQWPSWAEQTFSVAADAEKIMQVLSTQLPEADWKIYRGLLVRVGRTVAEAYGEFGEEFDDEASGGLFGKLVDKITGRAEDTADEAHINISAAEDAALSELAAALRAGSPS